MRVIQYIVIKVAVITAVTYIVKSYFDRKEAQQ